ncbi:uncharacterized protein LOC108113710 [Drosophila eugracilis]|uniref:uncharacterized protein LOC108113710 n=1 Tax=Drosophila eugracilis TaxID=29029 RepID=UPI001BDA5ACC|nr:uncharacterized protein LOC108113710 [Drosophila eugracilis]
MLMLRVLFVVIILIIGNLLGDCAVIDHKFHSSDDDSLIESQSMARIVNRISHKESNQFDLPPSTYVGDITRTSSVDPGNPCLHASSDIPQINAAQEPKINGNPSVTQTQFSSHVNTHSTYSTDFQLQIQNTRPVQHIHYHYLVPNTSPKPQINYVSQSQTNAYNVNSENKHSSVDLQPSNFNGNNLQSAHREVNQVNPLYSAVGNGEYLYDSADEHQGQASENTSVYQLRDPGFEITPEENPIQAATVKTNMEMITREPVPSQQVDAVSPNPPEVYFIKYYGNANNKTTISPDTQKPKDSSNEITDGSGLIDIRSGIEEILLDSQVKDSNPNNEHSAYNVPLN